MATLADYLGGLASGGLAGFKLGGIPGAVAGGGVSLLAGLFSPSDEDVARKQFEEFYRELDQMKMKIRREAVTTLQQALSTQFAEGRQAGTERAFAAGRGGLAESFIAPIEGRIGKEGANALRQLLSDIEREYGGIEAQARLGFAGRPIQPNALDVVQTLAPGIIQYGNQQEQQKMQKDYYDQMAEYWKSQNKIQPKSMAVNAPFSVESDITFGTNRQSPLTSTSTMFDTIQKQNIGATPGMDFYDLMKSGKKPGGASSYSFFNYMNQPGVGNSARQGYQPRKWMTQ